MLEEINVKFDSGEEGIISKSLFPLFQLSFCECRVVEDLLVKYKEGLVSYHNVFVCSNLHNYSHIHNMKRGARSILCKIKSVMGLQSLFSYMNTKLSKGIGPYPDWSKLPKLPSGFDEIDLRIKWLELLLEYSDYKNSTELVFVHRSLGLQVLPLMVKSFPIFELTVRELVIIRSILKQLNDGTSISAFVCSCVDGYRNVEGKARLLKKLTGIFDGEPIWGWMHQNDDKTFYHNNVMGMNKRDLRIKWLELLVKYNEVMK